MPIFVKDKRKIVFIHIPKSAGSTITKTFENNGYKTILNMEGLSIQDYLYSSPQHLTGENLKNLINFDFIKEIFTVVRNPYERLISEYRWSNRNLRFADYPIFDEWVTKSLDKTIENSNYADNHFRPMSDFLRNINNCKIFKYEEGIEKVFEEYLEKDDNSGFKIINKNISVKSIDNNSLNFSYYLSNNTIQKIIKFYEKDFKNFSYMEDYIDFLSEKIRNEYKSNLNLINEKEILTKENNELLDENKKLINEKLDLVNENKKLINEKLDLVNENKKLFDEKKNFEKKYLITKSQKKSIEKSISWRIGKPLRTLSSNYRKQSDSIVIFSRGIKLFLKKLINKKKIEDSNKLNANPNIFLNYDSNYISKLKFYIESNNLVKNKRIVVYTAIFGNYDILMPPNVLDNDIDYICFSDVPRDDYGIWHIKQTPFYHPDPTRMARYVKLNPFFLLPDYDYYIWVDGNVSINCNIKEFIGHLKSNNNNLGLIPHPLRSNYLEEAEACKTLKKDIPKLIDRQTKDYLKNDIEIDAGLFETNVMVIKNIPSTKELFNFWWHQVNRYSKRDQLSLVWVFNKFPKKVYPILSKGISVRESNQFNYFTHRDMQKIVIPKKFNKLNIRNKCILKSEDKKFFQVKEKRLKEVSGRRIDIIVCVFNALNDVKNCLNSVIENLDHNQKIIIINDFSEENTSQFLRTFRDRNLKNVLLIENKENLGYVKSANIGLAKSEAEFKIILNSDTIVSQNWASKMLVVANSRADVGIVSPLSNAAGVQSIPKIKSSGKDGIKTAINLIPNTIKYSDIDEYLEQISPANLFPEVPLVHGFCIGIKKEVIEKIGYFDDVNFEKYYGEENDYCLRAVKEGFRCLIATNIFVYHCKSKSINEIERKINLEKSGKKLREIYGKDYIRTACLQGQENYILNDIRKKVEEFLYS